LSGVGGWVIKGVSFGIASSGDMTGATATLGERKLPEMAIDDSFGLLAGLFPAIP